MRRWRYIPSLTETAIVALTIGAVAAITGPRLSQGFGGADGEVLRSDLMALQAAIDLYAADHSGSLPSTDVLVEALSGSAHGEPYLESIPALRVGPNRGATRIAEAPGDGIAWVLDRRTGRLTPNAPAAVLTEFGFDAEDR